jgi:crossover junction endodeoxyribonuclease RuvC
MKLLSLDVATNCGWKTETASGVWNFAIKKDESSGMRLVRFKSKLKEICSLEGIDLITFERTAGFHKNAIIVQAELHGVLKIFCEENKIEYRAFSASEIKKFATGKGNANKEAMIKAAALKYGYQGKDDNEADAMHIFYLTKDSLNLQ